jgi:hypothetical protein
MGLEPLKMDPKIALIYAYISFFGEVYATYRKGSAKKCALMMF